MEEKKNHKWLILLIAISIVVIVEIVIILHFYNEKAKKNAEDNSHIDFIQLTLKNEETKDVNINGKHLALKIEDDTVYLDNKKIHTSDHNIDGVPNNVIVTNSMILVVKAVGQFGMKYSFYDLAGNEIKYVGQDAQYNDLKMEDGKLKVKPFLIEKQWMSGYRIGNLLTLNNETDNCSFKKLKDYPSIINEHKDDVLDADYYFYLSDNELTLKYDKVLLTVGDLDQETCVIEEELDNQSSNNENISNTTQNFDITKISVENGYSEVSLTNEEKEKINEELYNHLQPGNGNDPLFFSNYKVNENLLDDCKKLAFAKWYITFNNKAGYVYEKVLDKDELGNEFNKIKFSKFEDITKEMFNAKNLTCNDNSGKYGVVPDENGYVWLSPAGGGFVPIAIRTLSKYKNGNNYYLLIHTYLLNEENLDLTKENWEYNYKDNPNATSNSSYIKLKYGISGDKKYLISFEYLK